MRVRDGVTHNFVGFKERVRGVTCTRIGNLTLKCVHGCIRTWDGVTHNYIQKRAHIHTNLRTCIHTHNTHMRARSHTHTHIHTRIHTRVHTGTHTHTHTHVHAHVMCTHAYIQTPYRHTHTNARTHI